MTKKLFEGAHQARVDVDAAARVIGYAGSSGGAAASAIGALRQFGLVDGLRGDIAVSDLAMRILQPLDEGERLAALHEAASKPDIFGRLLSHFGGKLPSSDEPVRALLIRQEGFSAAGANELIEAFRETLTSLPDFAQTASVSPSPLGSERSDPPLPTGDKSKAAASVLQAEEAGELIVLPLGSACRAELRFVGQVSSTAYGRLIRHLELMKEMSAEDQPSVED